MGRYDGEEYEPRPKCRECQPGMNLTCFICQHQCTYAERHRYMDKIYEEGKKKGLYDS